MDTVEIIKEKLNEAIQKNDEKGIRLWLDALVELTKEDNKLDVQREKNIVEARKRETEEKKIEKEYQARVLEETNNKEIELNKLGLEQRKFEAEQKCSKFNKGVTIAEKVIGFIQAIADIGQGFVAPIVNLKTAKINAEQKKLCTKMITEIEKEGEIPYQQATKHHTW